MMAKILIEHRPQAVVVAWDAGMSGREKIYEPYKAQRQPRPDLLKEQWPHLAPLAEAFGFTNVKVEGWEADDVIATLARQAREQEIPVMVVSGDRDVYQLVGDGVRVMTTSRGVTDTKIYDREGVIERYGVPPELVPDLIGLKGDTSDNIPGVPGIGDKTAAQLLQRVRLAGGGARQRRRDLRREAQAEPDRARRGRADLQAAGDDAHDIEVDSTSARMARAARPQPAARGGGGVRAAPGDPAARGGVATRTSPSAPVEETLEVEAERGDAGRPRRRARSRSRSPAGRWAASDGERWSTGERPTSPSSSRACAGGRCSAHDVKSLGGGGPHGLLAAAPPGRLELAHDTMVAAYLIDPARRTYELARARRRRGARRGRRDRRPTTGQLSLDAEEGDEPAGDPAADARLVWELADAPARAARPSSASSG